MNKMNDKEAIIEYLGHKAKFIFPDCYMSFRDIFAQNFELTRSECDKMKITVTANSGDSYKIENDFDYLLFYAEYKGSQDEFYLKVEIENNERNERLERKKRIIMKSVIILRHLKFIKLTMKSLIIVTMTNMMQC